MHERHAHAFIRVRPVIARARGEQGEQGDSKRMVGDGFHLAHAALDPPGALDAFQTTGRGEEVQKRGVAGDGEGHVGRGRRRGRQCVPRGRFGIRGDMGV